MKLSALPLVSQEAVHLTTPPSSLTAPGGSRRSVEFIEPICISDMKIDLDLRSIEGSS
jgi:hypothetical protein